MHTAHITPPIPATKAKEAAIMYTIIQSAREYFKIIEICAYFSYTEGLEFFFSSKGKLV